MRRDPALWALAILLAVHQPLGLAAETPSARSRHNRPNAHHPSRNPVQSLIGDARQHQALRGRRLALLDAV